MPMQNDRYSSSRQFSHCAECSGEYVIGTSRARDNAIFCSKRCEIEANFWLKNLLEADA